MGASENDPAALREVAGQFEALFLQSMLKSMRDASMGDPIFGDNEAQEMYQGMLDQQLAMEMASGKGIGLAEMLVRQLGGEVAAKPSPERSFGINRRSAISTTSGLESKQGESAAETKGFEIDRGEKSLGTERHGPLRPDSGLAASWDGPESFARDVWPHAQRVAKELNVPAQGVLAQAALETGWGQHVMPGHNGETSLNLFGIKAGNSWTGDSVAHRTIEFDGNVARREMARFRAYGDIASSFDDYAALMTMNARYESVSNHGEDIEGFAAALAESGYATDPLYAEKIARVAGSDTMARVLEDLKIAGLGPIVN